LRVNAGTGAEMAKPTNRANRGQHARRRSELERLLDRTVLGPTDPELGTCWRFTGTATPYGRMAKAQDSYTHRLGWKLLRGPIPEGKELHHRCGIYACWNPDHLQIVTHAENSAFKRKTHCKHGHPLSGDNVRVDARTGARVCRACARESQQVIARRLLRFEGNQGYLAGALTSSGCSTVLSWDDPIRS